MKKILLLLLLLLLLTISKLSYSQDTLKYNLSNTITGSYTSNTKQTNITLTGTNNFIYGKYNLFNTSNYSGSWVTKKNAEEISHKSNLTYGKVFGLYIFTHSFTRNILYDNSYGFGYIHWWDYVSLSYGVLYENTIYTQTPTIHVFRHSLRVKVLYKNIFSLEYYYQPNIIKLDDTILTGTTKLVLFQGKKVGLTITDILNYRSLSTTKMIHSATLGLTFNLKK
jgi:hypothetical protein